MNSQLFLEVSDHNRDNVGMTYVYPVVSRRASGVSIGINLNPNNACNWRCIYCQVPELTRGVAPAIDLQQLEQELRKLLSDILNGDFMKQHVPASARRLEDIAFSGNGEPTSSSEFSEAVVLVERVMRDSGLLGHIKLRLITNGSLLDKRGVLDGIAHLASCNGEVWFKVDAATTEGMARINDVHLKPESVLQRLRSCAQHCPTWVQTCVFALDGLPPDETEIHAYLDLLQQAARDIAGVHLYGLARSSMQPEATRLARLPGEWLDELARRIRLLNIEVHVNP